MCPGRATATGIWIAVDKDVQLTRIPEGFHLILALVARPRIPAAPGLAISASRHCMPAERPRPLRVGEVAEEPNRRSLTGEPGRPREGQPSACRESPGPWPPACRYSYP